mmetsp:Transcript_7610/g.18253  ORF Transcript_7610/g.18253 Transcript_7610/m.18253 type:complete len:231 (+) Transcript_7610:478-1170(+)
MCPHAVPVAPKRDSCGVAPDAQASAALEQRAAQPVCSGGRAPRRPRARHARQRPRGDGRARPSAAPRQEPPPEVQVGEAEAGAGDDGVSSAAQEAEAACGRAESGELRVPEHTHEARQDAQPGGGGALDRGAQDHAGEPVPAAEAPRAAARDGAEAAARARAAQQVPQAARARGPRRREGRCARARRQGPGAREGLTAAGEGGITSATAPTHPPQKAEIRDWTPPSNTNS